MQNHNTSDRGLRHGASSTPTSKGNEDTLRVTPSYPRTSKGLPDAAPLHERAPREGRRDGVAAGARPSTGHGGDRPAAEPPLPAPTPAGRPMCAQPAPARPSPAAAGGGARPGAHGAAPPRAQHQHGPRVSPAHRRRRPRAAPLRSRPPLRRARQRPLPARPSLPGHGPQRGPRR